METKLLEALTNIMSDIDNGILIRDISKDHEPNFGIRQLPLLRHLKDAQEVIKKASEYINLKERTAEEIATTILESCKVGEMINSKDFHAEIIAGLKEYRSQGRYFTADEIRILQDQAYDEGLNSEN